MNHNNEGPGKRPAFMDGPVRPLTVEETRAMAAYFVKEITEVRAESRQKVADPKARQTS